jgi:hypothetical protein
MIKLANQFDFIKLYVLKGEITSKGSAKEIYKPKACIQTAFYKGE